MKKVRLVIVDDHHLFRAGLISLLNEMPEFEVVAEASDGAGALEVVEQFKPDVVLLDVNMPGMSGVETVEELRKGEPIHIVMLTISKSETDLFGAIKAGADGYLLKSAEPNELRTAILQVNRGMSVLSPQVTRQVMLAVSKEQTPVTDDELSDREMDVLRSLAFGMTTAQIASKLYISENTVKTHVRHILEKLSASNRTEAVSKAIQKGILGPV
jgi:DNA-binding NarL/FixJ family response regulator